MKIISSPEEKKRREKEEELRKHENEQAFQAWLRNKEKQRIQEKRKNKTTNDKNTSPNQIGVN